MEVVPIEETWIKKLKAKTKLHGTLQKVSNETGLPPNTLNRVMRNGSARKNVADKLVSYLATA